MTSRSFAGLPELLAEIADVAGLEAALAIAEAKGGQRVYLPPYPKADHWLVATVGLDAAQKICEHFRLLDPDGREQGGRNVPLVVPMGPSAGAGNIARRRLEEGLQEGLPVREAARRAGLHERTGFYAKARMTRAAAATSAAKAVAPSFFDVGLEEPSKPARKRR